MTVRLLADYDRYPANAIVTLDAGTETGLINAKRALADLTGGVPFVPASAAIQSRSGTFTVFTGRAQTILLPEGQTVNLVGTVGVIGTIGRVDAAGVAISTPLPVLAGAMVPFGPFTGAQRVLIACTAGSIDATLVDAVLNAPIPVVGATGGVAGLSVPNSPVLHIPQPRSRKGSVVFDFSDTANWTSTGGGVTRTADATKVKRSAQALRCAFGAGASFDGIKKTFATGQFKIQAGSIMRLVYFLDAAAPPAGGISALFKFSSDGGASKSLSFNITNAYFNLGWGYCTFRAGEDGTLEFQNGGSWTAVGGQAWGDLFNYVEITFSGMQGASIWLDSFITGAKAIPRWSFSTDGTDPSILNIIAPAFAAYGWTGTAFIDGDPATVAAFAPTLRTLINKYGWKAGHQGVDHTDYNTNGRNIGADWDTGVASFLANGLPAPKMFAYPLNSSSRANDVILMNRGVVFRRAGGNPVLHNVGFGKPGGYDSMVRQGCNGHTDGNFDKGASPYLYITNRMKMLALTGGIQHIFTHNERFGAYDNLGGDATDFYRMCELLKAMEFSDGLENIDCEKTGEILDSEIFY